MFAAVLAASLILPQPTASSGLVLNEYSVGHRFAKFPQFAPGTKPNFSKLIDTVDFTNWKQFSADPDFFAVTIQGAIMISKPGDYLFRLTSDDGSQMKLDGELLIDNGGLHSLETKGAVISLKEGAHPLWIDYMEGEVDEALKLEWKTPGSKDWVVVPKDAFVTAHEPLPTAPGPKTVLNPANRWRPGDRLQTAAMHPAFEFKEIHRPPAIQIGRLPSLMTPSNLEPASDMGTMLTRMPYTDQLIYTAPSGEMVRAFVERIDGQDQGGIIRFGTPTKDVEGTMMPNGKTPFEPLEIKAKTNGFEIELTKPLMVGIGEAVGDYTVTMTPAGGAETPAQVQAVAVSSDRRHVSLVVPTLKENSMVYIRLNQGLASDAKEDLWTTEAWYTLNRIPKDQLIWTTLPANPNALTPEEQRAGFVSLFNGKDLSAWHGYKSKLGTPGWSAPDGAIALSPTDANAADLASNGVYGDFEMRLQWKISPGGNSGIMTRVTEDHDAPYETGPEMQVLDDDFHPDGGNVITSAGSNYAMYARSRDVVRPAGEWNDVRIICRGQHMEYWLNGWQVVSFELGSEDWKARAAKSKFDAMPDYGKRPAGSIVLQNHGDKVWYRAVRVRKLP